MVDEPEIKEINPRKLVGICITTNLADDKTSLLWNRFMKLKAAIKYRASEDLYSVQVYGKDFIEGKFDAQSPFQKWAATEVTEFGEIPQGLEQLEIPPGKYAVFTHEGTAREFAVTSAIIFNEWLPGSGYLIDDRPHFEVLGEDYKGPDDPDSLEKIWIPVRPR